MTEPQRPQDGNADDAVTAQLPQHGGTDIAGTAEPADDRRAAAAAVLDTPLDDGDLASRVHRPGMARSTWLLLAVLLAVALVALGTWIGRATAQRTGPGSVPDVVGTVESVDGGQITVRDAAGKATVYTVSPGTKIARPVPDGSKAVRAGAQVTVSGERNRLGGTDASLVELSGN